MRLIWGAVPVLLVAFACALAAGAIARGVIPNPANDPKLIDRPMDEPRYDYAEGCRDEIPSGMRALVKWLDRNVRGSAWGVTRCERLRDGWSVHSEGRAIDWHLDARDARDRRAADKLIETLLATDRNGEVNALARRMGIQGLIFNCRSWWSDGGTEMGRYSYCFKRNGDKRDDLNPTLAHKDHIHIELNWPGARKRTSFWKSGLAR